MPGIYGRLIGLKIVLVKHVHALVINDPGHYWAKGYGSRLVVQDECMGFEALIGIGLGLLFRMVLVFATF